VGGCRGGLGGCDAFVRRRTGGYIMKLHFSLIRRCFLFCSYLLFVPLLYDHGDGTIHDRFGKFDEQTNGWTDGWTD